MTAKRIPPARARASDLLGSSTRAPALSRRQWLQRTGLAVAAAAGLPGLAGCGGGAGGSTASASGDTGGGTASASSYASGAITGFGSIIVSGVRFDETKAQVLDGDGHTRSATALKLGVVVEVEGGAVTASSTSTTSTTASSRATATRIHCGSALLGPLEAIDATNSVLTVLGQAVSVSTDTVLDDTLSSDLSTWTLGQVLEVHALYDSATATYAATRIEDGGAPSAYHVRGPVSGLDTTAQTFFIGDAAIRYASATAVTSALADALMVRALLQTTAVDGVWIATQVSTGQRTLEDRSEARVHGLITDWTSVSAFSVNGLVVDASAASFPDGTSGIVLGASVEVQGAIVSAVLVATQVSLESSTDDSGSSGGSGKRGRRSFELHGSLSALDTTAQTFSLRGLTVSYASSSLVWLDSLSASTLADGLALEVRGVLSADKTQLSATRIGLDD